MLGEFFLFIGSEGSDSRREGSPLSTDLHRRGVEHLFTESAQVAHGGKVILLCHFGKSQFFGDEVSINIDCFLLVHPL